MISRIAQPGALISTQVPARLDRLPWSAFHWRVVFALGITWALDGLEVTFKGAVSGVLQLPTTLNFSPAQIGMLGSAYLAGAVLGALVFGRLADRYGRKRLFFVTLAVYLAGVGLSAFSWDLASFCVFRFLTGCGIGGEYAAINSAIDELIPARHRGRVALLINGTFWLGAALGAGAALVVLDPAHFAPDIGWRVGFGVGALLGLFILCFRNSIPESPRWLITHGRVDEAEQVVAAIERDIERNLGRALSPPNGIALRLRPRLFFGLGYVARIMFERYRARSVLCIVLMMSQAFLYNAIFFTYAMVLTRFYAVPAPDTASRCAPATGRPDGGKAAREADAVSADTRHSPKPRPSPASAIAPDPSGAAITSTGAAGSRPQACCRASGADTRVIRPSPWKTSQPRAP